MKTGFWHYSGSNKIKRRGNRRENKDNRMKDAEERNEFGTREDLGAKGRRGEAGGGG